MELTKVSVTYRRSFPTGPTPNCATLECSAEATLEPGEDAAAARVQLFEYCREGVREAHNALTNKPQEASHA